MKKFVMFIVFSILLSGFGFVNAQDLLPSDSYYKDNIAVNEVKAEAPSLRLPDGGGPGDGPGTGNVEWGDGGWVGAPVGDAILPIVVAGLIYGSVLFFRRRKSSI